MIKNKSVIAILSFVLLSISSLFSQTHDFGFARNDSVKFTTIDGQTIDLPWLGGINSCQFFEMDLDQNGINDLVIFDKHGGRTLPFLKFNSCGLQKFVFAPQYRESFPPFESWVQSHDFNMDGKMDLYTYTTAGIRVYKNTSDGENLNFTLHSPRLTSNYGSGVPINLFCNSEDYPAIADIDNDGDLDILNFWTLGMYVDYHKSTSIETHGNLDSLDFELETRCWGYFSEHENSNILFLDDECNNKTLPSEKSFRHTGSTLLAYDFFGNGLKDLLVGDVDYPQLILLKNGGTLDSAYMVLQDTLFPNATKPVRLYSMPAASLIDINFDGQVDLLVSPFDPSLNKAENKKSVWAYLNTGTNEFPNFNFHTDAFIQNQMIDFGSGAYPTFCDINGDGLSDMIVGNWGEYDSSEYIGTILKSHYSSSLSLILNNGTPDLPLFEEINDDLGNLRQYNLLGLFPTAYDIDNDGDIDILVGQSDGTLLFLENTAGENNPPIFNTPIFDYSSINVGHYAAPQLFDLDKDGKVDLLIGNRAGKIAFYKNTGTPEIPNFSFVTDFLGGVDVRDYSLSYFGYSTPHFFRYNDTTYLLVGTERGKIHYYKNIDDNLEGNFTLIEEEMFFVRNSMRFPINEGIRTAVAIKDLNNDNLPELIVGNFAGGLTYFSGIQAPPINIDISEAELNSLKIKPNPAHHFFQIITPDQNKLSSIKIYDISGRLIENYIVNMNNKYDISKLKTGIYYCVVHLQNGFLKTIKLIKQE
ncbi:MAG: T9SS type A sorting domain-containing protein [Bacteroidales bacterium]|nr:T9SS type A sorting domain-containing protein [Bacteroidales bacterium]